MTTRKLSLVAGISYLVIFFTAIYANFFVLDGIIQDPVNFVTHNDLHIRLGSLAFLIAGVFDVVVAWALYEMYKKNILSTASTYFRIIHAVIMSIAVFALISTLNLSTSESILSQVDLFNTLWLIGLLFFGVHLLLLGRIVQHIKVIPLMLTLAGIMYIVDTGAHVLLEDYDTYADIFLTLVAIPSIFGEMAFSIWLLAKGGKK